MSLVQAEAHWRQRPSMTVAPRKRPLRHSAGGGYDEHGDTFFLVRGPPTPNAGSLCSHGSSSESSRWVRVRSCNTGSSVGARCCRTSTPEGRWLMAWEARDLLLDLVHAPQQSSGYLLFSSSRGKGISRYGGN
jgi:hypothetical protein